MTGNEISANVLASEIAVYNAIEGLVCLESYWKTALASKLEIRELGSKRRSLCLFSSSAKSTLFASVCSYSVYKDVISKLMHNQFKRQSKKVI